MMISRILMLSLALICCGGATTALAAPASEYEYFVIGDPRSPTPGKTETALMLSGGGNGSHEAWSWFAQRSGHGHLVVLRATPGDELQRELARDLGGFASYETVVFTGRSEDKGRPLEAQWRAPGLRAAISRTASSG